MGTFKKFISFSSLIWLIFLIFVLIFTFYLGMRYQRYKSFSNAQPLPIINSSDATVCNSDADCTRYGTCSVNCVNKNWVAVNPDNGPFCNLLLPEFECKCIESKCKPDILDKTNQ